MPRRPIPSCLGIAGSAAFLTAAVLILVAALAVGRLDVGQGNSWLMAAYGAFLAGVGLSSVATALESRGGRRDTATRDDVKQIH